MQLEHKLEHSWGIHVGPISPDLNDIYEHKDELSGLLMIVEMSSGD